MARLIDADALNAVIVHRHDFFRGCTAAPEKARRDELLQVMCDINEQPTIDAIPVEWLQEKMLKPQMTDGNPFGFVLAEWLDESGLGNA